MHATARACALLALPLLLNGQIIFPVVTTGTATWTASEANRDSGTYADLNP